MTKLILLHYKADYSSNDIWKAAIKRGFKTDRIHDNTLKREPIYFYDCVRYYGNTLQVERIENDLPFKFYKINPFALAKADIKITGRKIDCIKYNALSNFIGGKPYFIKPFYQKYFLAKIYQVGEAINGAALPDDWTYIQDVIDIEDEIRCFVLNGEILTSSYYRKNKELYSENTDDVIRQTPIPELVKEIWANFKNELPPGVVLDFGLTKDKNWIWIEPNEAWASGLYDCNPDACLNVILESQYDANIKNK